MRSLRNEAVAVELDLTGEVVRVRYGTDSWRLGHFGRATLPLLPLYAVIAAAGYAIIGWT